MRYFSIHEVMALSGMTRGQVNQFISRYGFGCYGRSPAGLARQYHPADVWNFMAAAELSRLGVTMPTIRDMLITHMGMYRWDPEWDHPAEMYPGQGGIAVVPEGHLMAYFWHDGKMRRRLMVAPIERPGAAGFAGVVINASAIANRIHEAAKAVAE